MKELFTFPTDELLQENEVVVSISLNSESNSFETEANQIQFQNLLKEAKEKLCEKYDEKYCDSLLEKVEGLRTNTDFWRKVTDSVIIYITPDDVYYYRLSVPVHNGTVVSDQAYILPLISNFQYISYYHLLCLNHDKFRLFNGRGNKVQEIELPEDAPTTLTKALGEELTGGALNVADYAGGAGTGMFHGHNEKSNEVEIDQVNYFRAVDKYIYENFSKPTELPLVLFALPENIADFEKISKNEFLDDTKVEASPAQLSVNDIQDKTSEVVNEIVNRRYQKLVDRYEETTPEFKLGAQYADLAMASIQGKIDTLLLEDHYQVHGRIDENGQYHEGTETNIYVNQLVHNVLKTNGQVYVLKTASMPSDTGIAALLRF
ncbi:hypothetical protein SAMN04488100_12739 [Alkalibacterium putridalgicola]|uniref:Bacterial archaeo-eukaryotic release factor family 6 domain-containing protein n=1 Tax=Alkalibacterium putridalgicola TaxID=426703 RepID=A0A1H7VV30_9LACT|nr:hypothetical protein [Alkalibacterium putridalgicola]GEK89868.1 hypothetical protein APU01nite_19070 [Alkalibacterium putridalgicola]SEM12904.1 hypothetical protein SAMN04488100_12739 [Alkalibacterium putridalgicola]